jgi:hypothetical protein
MINYFLAISAILNSVLIMTVIGIIPFFLYTSIIINILLIWFVTKKTSEMNELRDDTFAIFETIEQFSDHLDNLHELDTFYGDQNLQNLMTHARQVINDIIDVQEKYYDDVEATLETYEEEEKTE